MFTSTLAFLITACYIYLIITFEKFHHIISDSLLHTRPQKNHISLTPRIGGAGIFFGILTSIFICHKLNYPFPDLVIKMIICSIPIFFAGLAEDITGEISATIRLAFAAFSAFLINKFLNVNIGYIDFYWVDVLLSIKVLASIFTIFCIVGLVNAYNIIDGFNGLSSLHGIFSLLLITYLSLIFGELDLFYISVLFASGTLGFLIWNYPSGKIFLGDCGSYLLGFWIATLTILLISRHPTISPWLAITLNIYPVVETLFTIYRRVLLSNKSPLKPDGMHFHSILYRRILKLNTYHITKNNFVYDPQNPTTSFLIFILSMLGMIPGIIWPESTPMLIICLLAYTAIFLFLYMKIIRFNSPLWLLYLSQKTKLFK